MTGNDAPDQVVAAPAYMADIRSFFGPVDIEQRVALHVVIGSELDSLCGHPLVNLDFRIGQEQLLDRKLSVEIDLPGHDGIGTRFPLAQAGDPAINVRLLLEDE
jgi:hypothetical protein